ncbi:MAG: hypothetical protein A3A51_02005 [Candidatus Levybacteria bacterium RIFCSPLOWO2_01_FULL_39_10]|nr:MAG: hypothetical protein A3A51_02005 [Candidatus Levybacteria bacterium RIFCSPLOWO2_01_FULL_39_10]
MEKEQRSSMNFESSTQRPHQFNFDLAPNSRLIIKGESRRTSEPIRGTGKARRNTNKNNRRR